MYLRTVRSKTKDGQAEYLQLCHNNWDRKAKSSKARVLYNFGRVDRINPDTIHRLIATLSRLLPEEDGQVVKAVSREELTFRGSRQLGGTWLLHELWQRLKIDRVLRKLLQDRRYQHDIERLLFALVAHRALAPASKLSMEHWVSQVVHIPDLPEVDVHQLYRAMDFLLEANETLQYEVFFSVANLLNLTVDLIFLDTTTTYFEIETEDPPTDQAEGLRQRGYGKDNHPENPQVVIAFAVTRDGIPVRCWVFPGNTSDQNLVQKVKADLTTWRLGRVVMVQDSGFNSAENRRILQKSGGHYIIGEKMRLGTDGAPPPALKQKGRFHTLDNGLQVKEAVVGGNSAARRRFVIVRNPEEANRDRRTREDIVSEVTRRLESLQQLSGEPHRTAACALRSHATYGRYVRQTATGILKLNQAKIAAEARYDGKYLLSTSDDWLPMEDMVAGYQQLAGVERVFRDLKHLIDLRPVYHRLADRIKAHVLLCWLAMLLIRVTEHETGQTWFQMKKTFFPIHVGFFELPSGTVSQSNPLNPQQISLYKALKLTPPPRFLQMSVPES